MLEQAEDFRAESESLYELIASASKFDWDAPTLFKEWTPNNVLRHLHFWNIAADRSLTDEPGFLKILDTLGKTPGDSLRDKEVVLLDGLQGEALLNTWRDYYTDMGKRWLDAEPKRRLKWAGPDMSARSSITARLMETWSHAQAVFDLQGQERQNTDRIKNVAVIGINTFGWTFVNRGEPVPEPKPYVRLHAPSGAIWEWHEPSSEEVIEGDATQFCQVVTQCRNIHDTQLRVTGEVATRWMSIAQCFAGGPQDPPPSGSRRAQA